MKSISKLIHRFIGIMMLSIILLVILNVAFYAIIFARNMTAFFSWDMAEKAADALQLTDKGYSISDDIATKLKEQNVWAVLIDDDTRQVIVDFMNMDIDDRFPIEWKTDDPLSACYINDDKDLLKRAISNLIQNSINHNENGCVIYAFVDEDNNACKICIEDSGIGASDEQINKLNNTPHYMVCDTNITEQRHGLGLLIVKQIINGHNGKVFIDHSEYGGFKAVLIIPK